MNDTYDIAIVGAGPAGSSAAIRLAAAGKSVVLIEKAKFPRQKLCGEFVSPECLEHFAELGVLDRIRSAGSVELKETIFYGRGGRGVAVPSAMFGSLHENAVGVSRAQMDLQLLERAQKAGVEIRQEAVASEPLMKANAVCGVKVRSRGVTSRIEAGLVLDATGRVRAVARSSDPAAARATAVAFKIHVRGVAIPEGRCEIFSYKGGYGGTSRVEGGLHNVCFIVSAEDVKRLGSDPERVFREVVCSNRRAAEVFKEVQFADEWLAVPIERLGRAALSPRPGLITIGDAAAFIDPFTGSGMLLALQSAKIAAESVISTWGTDQLAGEYARRYSAAFDGRLRVCSWLRRASFVPFLAEAVIFGMSLNKGLVARVARATRGRGGASVART